MRLTQFRINATECGNGMIAVSFLKVTYEGGKAKGHEVVLNDWVEPGQLESLAVQFLGELAAAAYRTGVEMGP